MLKQGLPWSQTASEWMEEKCPSQNKCTKTCDRNHMESLADQTKQTDGIFVAAGIFKNTDHRIRLPKFLQCVYIWTRWGKDLDIVYLDIPDSYRILPHPPIDPSECSSVLLLYQLTHSWLKGQISFILNNIWFPNMNVYLQVCEFESNIDLIMFYLCSNLTVKHNVSYHKLLK